MRAIMYGGSAPGRFLYRRGASGQAGSSLIDKPAKLHDQQCINAVANRSLVDETARNPLSALEENAQTTYLENWELRASFLRVRKMAHWLSTTTRNREKGVLSLLTWEHTVMKNGGWALADRLSAIRLLHLVEGIGDFAGKSFRIRALIEAEARMRGVNQRLPNNP